MSWKDDFIRNSFGENVKIDEQGILRCPVGDSYSYAFHTKHTKGAHLRKLANKQYHQIQWETPYYLKVLEEYLEEVYIGSSIILDFGCGDGRFSEYLLEKGCQRLICVDFDYATLVSLSEFVTESGLEDRVLIVHSDFANFPLPPKVYDCILGIGVLYYLNERYEAAMKELNDSLTEGGLLITSDPSIEGFFLRTMMFDSFGSAMNVWRQRRFKETKEETGYVFRVFGLDEWIKIFEDAGFEIMGDRGISLFHNLLRVQFLRGQVDESTIKENESDLREFFDYLHDHGGLVKHKIWKLQKTK